MSNFTAIPVDMRTDCQNPSVITGVTHISYYITDLERACAFYDSLGLKRMFGIATGDGQQPWAVFYQIVPGTFFELMPITANNPHPLPASVRRYKDSTFFHIALSVESLERAFEVYGKHGMRFFADPRKEREIFSAEQAEATGCKCRVAWILDPDDNPIELVELNQNSWQIKYAP